MRLLLFLSRRDRHHPEDSNMRRGHPLFPISAITKSGPIRPVQATSAVWGRIRRIAALCSRTV